VTGGIHLHDIHTFASRYIQAGFTFAAGLSFVVFSVLAINSLCQKPRNSGFTHCPRTAKKISMRHPSALNLMLKRYFDMILPHNLSKGLRPVFTVKCGHIH
jgi:hypothetical protein